MISWVASASGMHLTQVAPTDCVLLWASDRTRGRHESRLDFDLISVHRVPRRPPGDCFGPASYLGPVRLPELKEACSGSNESHLANATHVTTGTHQKCSCLRRPLLNSPVLAGGQPECTPTLNQERFNPASSHFGCAAPTRGSELGGSVRFGAAAGILAAAAPSRSRSITLDSSVVTMGLQSSIKPTRSRRSRGREEAISPGGSSVQDARLSTWWKQPDGSLTRPARLNPRRTSLVDPPSGPAKATHICFPKLTSSEERRV